MPCPSARIPCMADASDADLVARARSALGSFQDPWLQTTLSELNAVREVAVEGREMVASLVLPIPVGDYVEELAGALGPVLAAAGVDLPVRLRLGSEIRAHAVQRQLKPLETIRNVV